MSTTKSKRKKLTGEAFDALPPAEKERIWRELDSQTADEQLARSKPVSATERQAWQRVKKKMGRPKLGANGVKVIAVSLEKELLKRADAYAKRNKLKRSELITKGIEALMATKP